jgi:hypothetical protein
MSDIVKVCKIHGELSEREIRRHHRKRKPTKKGFIKIYLQIDCRQCANARSKKSGKKYWEQRKITDKLHYERTRQHHIDLRKIHVLKKFGLTVENYKNLIKQQENKCAICGNEETALNQRKTHVKPLAIDHDHVTGKVRALLCGKCNAGIGMFRESEELLQSAINYIRRHKNNGV